jgi:F0F1-type ATP synthase assembly protein I
LPPPAPIIRYARYGAVAFEFSGTIAAGAVVGWMIDRWLGSDPYGVVIMTLLAVVGGFARLIQLVRDFDRRDRGGEP